MTLKVGCQKTQDQYGEVAKFPTKAHPSDAGWDLYAAEAVTVPAHSSIPTKIHTGLQIELPPGTVGRIADRSGLASRGYHTVGGVIDPGYTGPVLVQLHNHTEEPLDIQVGDRIAQLLVLQLSPAEMADTWQGHPLPGQDNLRGTGGFGSTGV